MNLPIYFDNNATTPMDPRVFEAMRPYFTEVFGNPGSKTHSFGWAADKAVREARNQVAALLNVDADDKLGAREIIWTSGATESNNLAIKGAAASCRGKGRHIITQVTEHKAVIDPCRRLEEEGCRVTWLEVDAGGRVSAGQVADALRDDTVLVSIMWANNETGVIQPVAEIGALCHSRGVFFHTDATQAVGKIPVDVQAVQVDLLSFSGHKLYGPKGCGGLFVRRKNPRVRLLPLIDGGGHERGLRSGTLNVPGIVGVGAACEIAREEMPREASRLTALRDRLEHGLIRRAGPLRVNGGGAQRLPQVSNVSFQNVEGESLLLALGDVAVSSGSACTSSSMEASHVLRSMGVSPELARASIRFSLGRFNTEQEVDYVLDKIENALGGLRGKSEEPACRQS